MSNGYEEDRILVEQIEKKDERALIKVFRLYRAPIFTFVNRQIRDVGLSEELTEDIFLSFIEHVRDYRAASSLRTYLYSIARHRVIDYLRKKKIKKILFSALPDGIIDLFCSRNADDEEIHREISAKIEQTMKKLPSHYRMIIQLKYIEGKTIRAIAKKLATTLKASESLLFRARRSFIRLYEAS